MFGKKNTTPCTLTVEELPDATNDILIPLEEYKDLVRKEIALDLLAGFVNDKEAKEELSYRFDTVLMCLLRHIIPEKFVPDEPEPDPDAEKDGEPF